jgi:hypothetical protein
MNRTVARTFVGYRIDTAPVMIDATKKRGQLESNMGGDGRDVVCPACRGINGGTCHELPANFDGGAFHCEMCGPFQVSGTALSKLTDVEPDLLSPIQRAALSYRIRSNNDAGSTQPFITSDWLAAFITSARLPTPAEQAANFIRFIGNEIGKSGNPLHRLPTHLSASIGSPNPVFAGDIAKQLYEAKLIAGAHVHQPVQGPFEIYNVTLTLSGWERYEAETSGKLHGRYGFLALKFGDPILDPFVNDIVKPCIKAELGFDLLDMRDAARAGIIDNIMRAQIQDAAFVLVDLTHDNSGTYWEGGYAEGLGKPVIYLCEKAKFDQAKTHFDTNHCTTVPWSLEDREAFKRQLIATLRRSLNLFPRND